MKTSALASSVLIAAALALSACAKGAGDANDNLTVSNDIADSGNLTDTPSDDLNGADANLTDVPANAL